MIFLKENNNKCNPLLFIDFLSEDIKPYNQECFDSREKRVVKKYYKNHDEDFYIKINRLIIMYNRNKKIECKIYLLSKEEYLVVITKFENDLLSCRMLETNEELVINVHEIDEITIEKIN